MKDGVKIKSGFSYKVQIRLREESQRPGREDIYIKKRWCIPRAASLKSFHTAKLDLKFKDRSTARVLLVAAEA